MQTSLYVACLTGLRTLTSAACCEVQELPNACTCFASCAVHRRRLGCSPSFRYASRRCFNLQMTDLVRLLIVHRMQVQRERERLSLRELAEQTLAITACKCVVQEEGDPSSQAKEEVGNYSGFSEAPLDETAYPFCGRSSTRPGSLIRHVSLRIFWPYPPHIQHHGERTFPAVGVITHGRRKAF